MITQDTLIAPISAAQPAVCTRMPTLRRSLRDDPLNRRHSSPTGGYNDWRLSIYRHSLLGTFPRPGHRQMRRPRNLQMLTPRILDS